jgi:phosphoglycolate phosphatase
MDERMMNDKKLARPRAVIFDWDNTLVDAWGCVTDAMNVVRVSFGQSLMTTDDVIRESARSARAIFYDWYGDQADKALNMFYDHYRKDHLRRLKALPDAHELLCWLAAQNIPRFVVSNKSGDLLRQEAVHLGWEGLFAALVGSTDALHDKPARDPVDMALGRSGLKADDPAIWFVGDTHGDVACARNAGCTPVLVNNVAQAASLGVGLSFLGCRDLLDLLYTLDPSA